MSSYSKYSSFLNQIPTKLRGKYISLINNKAIPEKDLIVELEKLIEFTNQKILPKIIYPDDLPVTEKVDDIKNLIKENQVIIVAGETGSGKSTQLPKICLDLGLGKRGLIGHTQPRRIAAKSIAKRIAQEIKDNSKVAFKIRFSDQTSENTIIKVMTDGVLLSEIKHDKFLSQYEVIIIDEAHERSLNIDFLLGYIKKILPFRPDLKVIITSATIDHQKFINYFNNAKDIIISGRTYPVEIRYQNDEDFEGLSLQERILCAIDELEKGDILVFLPTERDIHDTLSYLKKQNLKFTEILPLFSRLSNKEQNKIFNPDGVSRRIILATNVAETSLTVPRIKYVIDSGLARVSRYSYRTKVQRLPIEKISQASANQRAGRCGRLSAGICIRLYSEEDFNSRPKYTDPEILRTNLASVILQMLFLQLGNIQDFPFIDMPDSRFIKDGFKLLFELQAITKLNYSNPQITDDGKKMAMMPLDPKFAKIVIEGYRQNVLREIITIVSFLSVQDPRERPLNFQQKADEKHAIDKDNSSDFITILNLAKRLYSDLKGLSNKEKKEYFRYNFISPIRFNEWNDIYRQIVEVIHQFKWKLSSSSDQQLNYENIHKAIASGFLSNVGFNNEDYQYIGARGLKFFIFPGSSQFKAKPKWIVASEMVETTKIYARNVAKINPEWLENLASHLVKKNYDEPFWSKKRRSVLVNERVTLYGLEIISKRLVQYENINLVEAREIFIREALVNGNFDSQAYFYQQNIKLISEIEKLENKSRRKDILIDDEVIFEHYDSFIPEYVCSGVTFDKWIKTVSKEQQKKFVFDLHSLMQHDAKDISPLKFPDVFTLGYIHLPLEYCFDPLDEYDGVTVTVPVIFLNDINPIVLEWGIYGFLYEKIVALLRCLPKQIRKKCVPVTACAQSIFESINFNVDRYLPLKSVIAKHLTRLLGFVVEETAWQNDEIDKHLILNIKVVDDECKTLAIDKDIEILKHKFKDFTIAPKQQNDVKVYYDWSFAEIPETSQVKEYGIDVTVYNCLEEYKDGVRLSYKSTLSEAQLCMKNALKRLIKIRLQDDLSKNIKNNDLTSLSTSLKLNNSKDIIVDKVIDLSFFDTDKLPYSKQQFEDFYYRGLNSFEANKSKVESLFLEINLAKEQLDKKLNIKKIPLNFIELFTNVKDEINDLFNDNYMSVPIVYLQRYKYYLEALSKRLDKAKFNTQRDRDYQIEVNSLKNKLNKKIIAKYLSSNNEIVIRINFLIKELWISWYLQSIKTIESVSIKRINEYINQI
ncbi:MAG: hypothetical protein Kow0076_0840 [Francisella sp.]